MTIAKDEPDKEEPKFTLTDFLVSVPPHQVPTRVTGAWGFWGISSAIGGASLNRGSGSAGRPILLIFPATLHCEKCDGPRTFAPSECSDTKAVATSSPYDP